MVLPLFYEDANIRPFTRPEQRPVDGINRPSEKFCPLEGTLPHVTVPGDGEVSEALLKELDRLCLNKVRVGRMKTGGVSPYGNLMGFPHLKLFYCGFQPEDVPAIVAESIVRGNIISAIALINPLKSTDGGILFHKGTGFIAAIDESYCMVRVARYFMEWERGISCGKCVPCRVGSPMLLERLVKITERGAEEGEMERLTEIISMLTDTMSLSTYCLFGKTTSAPVAATIEHFADEYAAHIEKRACPAGVCTFE